jgi:cleavage and polyadenylation specificity factor subunit 1
VAGCFFADSTGIFEAHANPDSSMGTNGVDKTVTSTLQAAVNSEKRSQWLILVRPQGVMEVRSVPLSLLLLLI